MNDLGIALLAVAIVYWIVATIVQIGIVMQTSEEGRGPDIIYLLFGILFAGIILPINIGFILGKKI